MRGLLQLLASVGDDGTLCVANPASGLVKWQTDLSLGQLDVVRFSSDGALVATGGEASVVRVFNTVDGAAAGEVKHDAMICQLVWSLSYLVSAGKDGQIIVSSGCVEWSICSTARLSCLPMGLSFTPETNLLTVAREHLKLSTLELEADGSLTPFDPGERGSLTRRDVRVLQTLVSVPPPLAPPLIARRTAHCDFSCHTATSHATAHCGMPHCDLAWHSPLRLIMPQPTATNHATAHCDLLCNGTVHCACSCVSSATRWTV